MKNSCQWCGEDLSGILPRAIYEDNEGNRYCCDYCREMATQDERSGE